MAKRYRKEDSSFPSEQLCRSLLEHSPDIITRIDRELRHLYVNPAVQRATGIPPEEFIGKTNKELGMPESLCSYWAGELEKVFRSGSPNTMVEFDFETPEGQKYYQSCLVPEFGDDGSVRTVLVVSRDVTDRRKAELILTEAFAGVKEQVRLKTAELERANESLSSQIATRIEMEKALRDRGEVQRSLINASKETLILIDAKGTILAANEASVARWGKTVPEVIGTCVYDYFTPELARSRKGHFDRVVATGEPEHFVDTRDERVFEVHCNPVFASDGQVSQVAIFALDMTERTKAQEENVCLESRLRQSQKMEAIGTLAGGIAHDFNNILTAVIGYASLLRMHMERNEPKRIYVDHILSASEKAVQLTQSLLAFSRKQVIDPRPMMVNTIIRRTQRLLKTLLTEDIEFKVVLSASDAMIKADGIQIDQVLMNLATNARDAMPKGGRFTIATGVVWLDERFLLINGFGQLGEYAIISVSDTGIGMDQKTKDKVFEPFFTTKEVGKGTGLGLSTVYGIVKQHNGYITVESEPGKGTTFTIYFPIAQGEIRKERRSHRVTKDGKETILVAEDNADVRSLAREILESKGYTVIEAVDGGDAVRAFMEHRDDIALLLLDVVMPRKNGKEAYEEIAKVQSDVKVLFMSGHPGDVVLAKGVPDQEVDFIAKPLLPNTLLAKVREVLDR